jgi:chemotaxis protein CheZ
MSIERDKVVKLINSVIAKVEHAGDPERDHIYTELKSLKDIIDKARAELRSANLGDIKGMHIPTATDELDAIVKSTEGATMQIFSGCEEIERALPGVDEHHRNAIQSGVTKIYEACSFQDLTGQRITKVLKSIREIEAKVNAILKAFGGSDVVTSGAGDTRMGDAALMNGPQLPGQGVSQEDIDKLLAEFDN